MKILLLLALAVLAWTVWKRLARRGAARPPQALQPAAAPLPMVACSRCGLHLPLADATVRADGSHRCAEHAATP